MRILLDISNFTIIQIIAFGCLFLGIYYFTMYDDGSSLKDSIVEIQADIEEVSGKVVEKREELEKIKIFEREVLNQENVVKQFLHFIPSSLTYTEVSSLLIKEAKSSGINIEVKRDERIGVKKGSEYSTLTVRLKISGAFSQILLFLSKLTSQKRILVVNSINMQIDRETGLRQADLQIDTYRYELGSEEEEGG